MKQMHIRIGCRRERGVQIVFFRSYKMVLRQDLAQNKMGSSAN